MPGYGASAPPSQWTFEALAGAAATWITGFGAGAAHVVGLSMGGMVALHLALAEPALTRSLVLCDTSPAFGFDGTTTAGCLGRGPPGADPRRCDAGVDRRWCDRFDHGSRGDRGRRGDRERWHASIRKRSKVRSGAFRRTTCATGWPRSTAPTLVVVGELDRETPPSYARHLADHIAASRYVEIAGAGHISNLERPVQFNAALLDFLTTVGNGARG